MFTLRENPYFCTKNNTLHCRLPAKKWHWRARTSALYFSQVIPKKIEKDVLFCSSVLNLSELLSLRPDLASIKKKIVYFHENQLAYPVQTIKERDFQFGYNQILTCLVADKIIFNSASNKSNSLSIHVSSVRNYSFGFIRMAHLLWQTVTVACIHFRSSGGQKSIYGRLREHLPKKKMFSFGHCPNEGGGEDPARIKKHTIYIYF